MKKFFLTVLGLAVAAGLNAQTLDGIGLTVEKVNVKQLRATIAKSDAEIADAKKNMKAATWIKRGDAFVNADAKPVNGLYVNMPEGMLKDTYGDAAPEQVTIGGNTYSVYTYEHFNAYVADGQVQFFPPVTVIDPAGLDKAYDAYARAYELDAKAAVKKVAAGMCNIHNKSFENGSAYYLLNNYKTSSAEFRRAYRSSIHPASERIDTMALFYAGMAGVLAGDFQTALVDLDKTLEMGYDSGGEVYRQKFFAMYNLDEKEKAGDVLKHAVSLYPTNVDLIDLLMRYYAENDGDPSNLIPLVQDAIAKNPTNASLYQGLAQVYDKLGQNDNAIATIKKAVELNPGDFVTNYQEGLFIVKKGDVMDEDLRKMTITSRAQYETARNAVLAVFKQALAPLEKAYSIRPSELATVELLKNLSFRLRDEPGMNEKYEKYNTLYNSMNVQ